MHQFVVSLSWKSFHHWQILLLQGLRGRGGGLVLMARSASAAFGGCCGARSSWSLCASLCVLLGLVSPPGQPYSRCFAACVPPNLVLFFLWLAHSLLVCCARGGGGGGSVSLPASVLWLLGCPTAIWVALGAPGTSAHVSKSAN